MSVQSAPRTEAATRIPAPVGLLAELTHRCPLQCPYCSNPLALERVANELPTEIWLDVLAQAADLGVLQLHLSGGEPTVRRDLEEIVAQAAKVGLYSNLITSAVTLTRERLEALAARGLDHVQISIQDTDAANADRIAHYQGGHAKKLEVAGWVRALGPAAHPQRPHPSPEHRQPAGLHRSGRKPRRAAARGGARAVLRLGAEEPARP